MLQTIREHTQGWIAGTIVSIIIFSFAFWGIHSYFVQNPHSNVVARVNGVEVTKEQLTVAYERLRRQAQAQYGTILTRKNELAYKERALQSLIEVEVLKQASLKEDFIVTNLQIDNYLQSMPEFQVDGQFSVDRFQEVLSSTLMSPSDFVDLVKTSLLIEQPRLGMLFTSFALPGEVDYIMSLVNQTRNIDYVNIPVQYFLSKPMAITPERIQAYYDAHKASFMTPEQVNVEYIQLSMKDLYAKVAPLNEALKAFYNENINSYTQPMAWQLADIHIPFKSGSTSLEIAKAQAKADELVAALKKGGDFDALAHQHLSKINRQNWLTLNNVPAELQKTAAELVRKDQVIGPVKTSDGFVILKAVEVRVPRIQSFEAVKDKVKETYARQHAEEMFANMRNLLADITYEHPESLQLAAKTLNLPIDTSESFSKYKAGKDISQFQKVRDIAFSHDVLTLKNNSDVIQLDPETVIVLRVKSHIASTLLSLKDVSRQIEDKLKVADADLKVADFANALLAQLNSGKADPIKLMAANQLKWVKVNDIGRYSSKVDTAILDIAFRLPDPVPLKKSATYGVTRLPNGYAVVAINAVKPGAIADKTQYEAFVEQVQNSQALLEYELYKQSLLANANIKQSV